MNRSPATANRSEPLRFSTSPHRQRGVAAVFAAIALVAAVTAFGLVFDIGQLYYAKKDLQRLANIAALDASHAIGGCSNGQVDDPLATAQVQAMQSLMRNGGSEAVDWLNDGQLLVGDRVSRNGLRTLDENTNSQRPAVRVTLSRPQPGLVMPLLMGGSAENRTLTATAASRAGPNVGLQVGSFAARVSSGQPGILDTVLTNFLGGGDIDLTLAGYQGLLDTQITLQDIIDADPRISTVPELVEGNFGLGDLLLLLADAATGTAQPVVIDTLEQLAAAADPARELGLGDVLDVVGDPGDAAGELFVNLGEFVAAAAEAANAGVPVNLGPILGLAGDTLVVDGSVVVQDAPVIVVSTDSAQIDGEPLNLASSSQAEFDLGVRLQTPLGASIEFGIEATTIQAEAEVADVRCASSEMPFHQVFVDTTTRAAAVRVNGLTINTGIPLIGTLNLGSFDVDLANRSDTPLVFGSAQNPTFPQTQSASAVSDDLSAVVVNAIADAVRSELLAQIDALTGGLPIGLPVAALLNGLLADITPLLTDILDPNLASVFGSLGLQVSGADIMVSLGVDRPVLFTHAGS